MKLIKDGILEKLVNEDREETDTIKKFKEEAVGNFLDALHIGCWCRFFAFYNLDPELKNIRVYKNINPRDILLEQRKIIIAAAEKYFSRETTLIRNFLCAFYNYVSREKEKLIENQFQELYDCKGKISPEGYAKLLKDAINFAENENQLIFSFCIANRDENKSLISQYFDAVSDFNEEEKEGMLKWQKVKSLIDDDEAKYSRVFYHPDKVCGSMRIEYSGTKETKEDFKRFLVTADFYFSDIGLFVRKIIKQMIELYEHNYSKDETWDYCYDGVLRRELGLSDYFVNIPDESREEFIEKARFYKENNDKALKIICFLKKNFPNIRKTFWNLTSSEREIILQNIQKNKWYKFWA